MSVVYKHNITDQSPMTTTTITTTIKVKRQSINYTKSKSLALILNRSGQSSSQKILELLDQGLLPAMSFKNLRNLCNEAHIDIEHNARTTGGRKQDLIDTIQRWALIEGTKSNSSTAHCASTINIQKVNKYHHVLMLPKLEMIAKIKTMTKEEISHMKLATLQSICWRMDAVPRVTKSEIVKQVIQLCKTSSRLGSFRPSRVRGLVNMAIIHRRPLIFMRQLQKAARNGELVHLSMVDLRSLCRHLGITGLNDDKSQLITKISKKLLNENTAADTEPGLKRKSYDEIPELENESTPKKRKLIVETKVLEENISEDQCGRKLFMADFQGLKEIGEGMQASAFKARYKGKEAICLKEYTKEIYAARLEAYTLQKLTHPQIVRFYGYVSEPNRFLLVLELCNTSLSKALKIPKGDKYYMDMGKRRILLKKLAQGIDYLHKMDVLHRDIKIDNILMMGEEPKLVDFGLSCSFIGKKLTACVGTIFNMAPEVFDQKWDGYGELYSSWQLGILVVEIMGDLDTDFFDRGIEWPLRAIASLDYVLPTKMDHYALDLLSRCLLVYPDKRWTVQQTLSHPFFKLDY